MFVDKTLYILAQRWTRFDVADPWFLAS